MNLLQALALCLTLVGCARGGEERRPGREPLETSDASVPREDAPPPRTDGGAGDAHALDARVIVDAAMPMPDASGRRDTGYHPIDGNGTCLGDGVRCGSGAECCGGRCSFFGTCAPDWCGLAHETCFAHSECCLGACLGGYCDGPEGTPPGAIDGVTCWSHGQCSSGVCSEEGYCVAATRRAGACSLARTTCFFGADCCSNACLPSTLTCASEGPGHWLP